MKLFLLGSLAFDELGHFDGYFKNLIQTEHSGKLSLSFVVEDVVQSLGGCAGNVAYGLQLLKVPATVCGLLGEVDGKEYLQKLREWGMEVNFISSREGQTARAVITSDLEGAQIAHFNPGVLGKTAPGFELPPAEAGDLFLLGPEKPSRMLQAAAQAKMSGLRLILDPGQMLHVFTPAELLTLLEGASGLIVNEYEWELFQEKTGLTEAQLLEKLDFLIVTLAEKGLRLLDSLGRKEIAAFPVQAVDSTGAGDAFRAGFLAGLQEGHPYEKAAEIGVVFGAACVSHPFAQGYAFTPEQRQVLGKLDCLP